MYRYGVRIVVVITLILAAVGSWMLNLASWRFA